VWNLPSSQAGVAIGLVSPPGKAKVKRQTAAAGRRVGVLPFAFFLFPFSFFLFCTLNIQSFASVAGLLCFGLEAGKARPKDISP